MNKKAAIVGLGILGAGALSFYLYQRNRGTQPSMPTGNQKLVTNTTTSQLPPTLSALEGKGLRNTDDGKIYIVRNGLLMHLTSPAVMQRELGSNNYQQLVQAGVITQVNSSVINSLPKGSALSGLQFSISPAI